MRCLCWTRRHYASLAGRHAFAYIPMFVLCEALFTSLLLIAALVVKVIGVQAPGRKHSW